jgi:hypothetical protein
LGRPSAGAAFGGNLSLTWWPHSVGTALTGLGNKAVAQAECQRQAQPLAPSALRSGRMDRAVRVGVVGLRRGAALARLAQQAGMQVVAVCERDDRRREGATALGAVAYRDVEPFLGYAMDAVSLVNDFDQHAPVAIQALDRGLSVLSETATYYCTHSLAPVAAITGTRPVQVSSFVAPTAAGPEAMERARLGRGWAALLVVRLDNGAVFKLVI